MKPYGGAEHFQHNAAVPQIVFLKTPESLISKISIEGFSIDPSIPIPVELPYSAKNGGADFSAMEDLTIEMIVSGMIHVICHNAALNQNNDKVSNYYRSFVLAFKPNILAEFKTAAMVHLQKGSYKMAHDIIAALDALFPESPEVFELKSIFFEERDVREDPNYKEAYRLISGGNEQAGMEKLRKFLELHPDSWNGWFMLGWALRKLKRWNEGIACFRKAIEAGGACADTYNELAICLMETGDYETARRELESALSQEPENIKIISNLAILALRTGQDTEAKALFRKALEIEPNDPLANKFFSLHPS
ncbi:MAG: tetratricopeptide repeat protein [Spirochaetaceae bacterium]|jgi:tetratricopeptide (TPR) repeat protein|nr:tetratricopeptide repeat protein [Spirochaetaceae bacterium]